MATLLSLFHHTYWIFRKNPGNENSNCRQEYILVEVLLENKDLGAILRVHRPLMSGQQVVLSWLLLPIFAFNNT